MRDNGFIKLSRKFFTNEFWTIARTYSACEAWLDLIQSARFEASPRTESIGGRDITWGRGQYPASVRYLSKKWRWSDRSVRSFLDTLKKRKMVTCDSSQGQNIITLCKYDDYNSLSNLPDTANDTTNDTAISKEINELKGIVTQLTTQLLTQGRHSGDTNLKKEEEREEYKEIPPIIPQGENDIDKIGFDSFWNLYDKKVGKKEKIQGKWNKLSIADKQKAIEYIPKYKESQPNKQYRKNPETFLNNRGWDDELIFKNDKNENNQGNNKREPEPSPGITSHRF